MGFHHSDTAAYGIRIEELDDDTYWDITGDGSAKVTDSVQLFRAGNGCEYHHYLVTDTQAVESGEAFQVLPYAGTDVEYLARDAALVDAAERIKAKPVSLPGWFFLSDES